VEDSWTLQVRESYDKGFLNADQGIITQSQYHVFVPEVSKEEKIEMECGQAYRHDNGLSHSERAIRLKNWFVSLLFIYWEIQIFPSGFCKETDILAVGQTISLADLGYASEEEHERKD
jgi:hypothetical protein